MSQQLRVAIADTFWDRLFDLPKAQQKKVRSFVTKFRQSPKSSGINYERINKVSQDSFRSVRIDQAYRCIVMAPEKGDIYILLWVDHHDQAYDWARRTRVEVHPNTGLLQIFGTEEVGDKVDRSSKKKPSKPAAPKTARLPDPLFNLDDTRLLGIGVPEAMVERIIDLRSVSELEGLQELLPTEAFEALFLFASGCTWDEIWDEYGASEKQAVDVDDIAAAIDRDGSKRRFHVVESDEELQAMLSAPLEKWRVYLHPSQRKLVERDWNGPVRVLGGAGTGKTVVAMHRAAWLVKHRLNKEGSQNADEQAKILFLTYNTNLAADIKQNLSKITSPEELESIEVINIDAWVSRFLKAHRYSSRIVREGELSGLWSEVFDASASPPGKVLPLSFYTEEWDRIIQPKRINSRNDYLRVSRAGRGVPLTRPQRAAVWDVFDEMRAQMQQKGWRTYQDATHDACDLIDSNERALPYRHVIVDETQDMGSEALTLIRHLVPEGTNDLFFVGDGHQRIYRRRAVMSRSGIKIVGRSRKLKINYRTTEQIRRFATAVLDGQPIDDLDDGTDGSKDYRSLTRGPEPVLRGFESEESEVKWIAEQAMSLCKEPGELARCCVMLRTRRLRDSYAQGLRDAGFDVVMLEHRADNQSVPGIRVATMHRVKGLEFRHVFLAGMGSQEMPNRYSVEGSEDPTELREHEMSERALVHVAATRAIENLMVTWVDEGSDYFNFNAIA